MNVIRDLVKYLFSPNRFFNKIYKKDVVLIVRTDNIGDYILFRNFLKILRGSPEFYGKKIVLVGNENWRDLAEHYDTEFVDNFFWINKNEFYSSRINKIRFIIKLRQFRAYTVINTVHSISRFEQDIVLFSGAKIRISCDCDDVNLSFKNQNHIRFNKIIPSSSNFNFEFFRNKAFFENLLQCKIDLNRTKIEIHQKEIKRNQIAIFPSAAGLQRRWSPINFSKVINSIYSFERNLEFIILGSTQDLEIAKTILNNCNENITIHNLCGKTTLIDLVEILNVSKLLISNETSAVHIAVAIDLPAVCISNGERFARFSPYPLSMTDKVITLYPTELFYNKDKYEYTINQNQYKSELNINDILPEEVFDIVKRLLVSLSYE
jgi:ADP-heptose:LPS heptosyltransferase